MPDHSVSGARSRLFPAGVFAFLGLLLLLMLALLAADIAYVNLDAVWEVPCWPEIRSAVSLSLNAVEIILTAYEYETTGRVSVIPLSFSHKRRLAEKFPDFCPSSGKTIFEEVGYVKS